MSMSTRNAITVNERLIIALDVPEAAQARALVQRIGSSGVFYKIGMELLMAPGFFELNIASHHFLHVQPRSDFIEMAHFK